MIWKIKSKAFHNKYNSLKNYSSRLEIKFLQQKNIFIKIKKKSEIQNIKLINIEIKLDYKKEK